MTYHLYFKELFTVSAIHPSQQARRIRVCRFGKPEGTGGKQGIMFFYAGNRGGKLPPLELFQRLKQRLY